MKDFEAILAKIAENTKLLDDKVVIDPIVLDELKSANAASVESVTAANAKTAELEAKLESVSAKCDTFETEKIISECSAYVEKTEKELVQASIKKEAEVNRRKEELAKAGVTSEKAIAMAVSVNEEGFETMLATFSEVAVAEQKKVIESKKVDIQKGQEELATIVANTGGASEMDLSEKMSFSEKFRTVSKKAIDKISK